MTALEKSGFGILRGLIKGKSDDESRPGEPAALSSGELKLVTHLLLDYEASSLGWFWSTDENGAITYISNCVAERFGKSRRQLIGTQLHSLFAIVREEEHSRQQERTLPLLLNSHKTFSEMVVTPVLDDAAGDEPVWWSISGRPQFSSSGEFSGYCGNGSDVTESYRSKRDASRLAMYDTLTGLANRNRMTRHLADTLTSCAAAKRSCAIMMIDLDRFKQVNDTFGHPAGDALLRQVAERMRSVVDEKCEIGRLGGDEFQVIMPDIEDRGHLGETAKKIIAVVSQPYSLEEGHCIIGASLGIAIAPYDGIDSETLVRNTDLALYAAKGGGRGQFRFYSADLHAESERRRQLEQDLGQALERDEMRLVYQPQVDSENRVVTLQAGLSWEHPDFDEIPPDVFLPIAHESNLIGPLNDWALRRACEDIVQLPRSVKVAVRVSPTQVSHHEFPALVAQALARSELAPDRLELELPQTIFGTDRDDVEGHINSLKMLGVGIVLVGFGQEYAALEHLRRISFDKVKIGETFVRGLVEGNGEDGAIIRAIVGLARDLRMETVADGAAAHDELDELRRLNVGLVQGPLFSKAVPLEMAADAMANGSWTIEPTGPQRYRDERRTVLRKVGLIHENYRYEVRMKNLSRSGCLIEGLVGVPVDTQFVVDFGNGQLAVATVNRSAGTQQALEFELPLVDDGAGGLVTRNRVSPYVLAAAGMPLGALPPGSYPLGLGGNANHDPFSTPKFAQVEKA